MTPLVVVSEAPNALLLARVGLLCPHPDCRGAEHLFLREVTMVRDPCREVLPVPHNICLSGPQVVMLLVLLYASLEDVILAFSAVPASETREVLTLTVLLLLLMVRVLLLLMLLLLLPGKTVLLHPTRHDVAAIVQVQPIQRQEG